MKIMVAILLSAAFLLCAQTITLDNGETYTGASVIHSNRNGVLIRGWRNDMFVIRFVPYNQIAQGSSGTFYGMTASGKTAERIRREIRRIMEAEKAVVQTGNPACWNRYFFLPGIPHQIVFTCLENYGNGSVGDAVDGPFGTGSFRYGRIFIPDLTIPQDNQWAGIVYPTVRTVPYEGSMIPCCTTDPQTALQINENGVQ